jgi:hypothetical protein
MAGKSAPPRLFVEPPIPTTTEFSTVEHVRGVIHQLDIGHFRQPALLVERMLWNPRLRAVVETRLSGLIATEILFEPAQNNRDARRAAKELHEDFPLIASAPMRKQMLKWALFLGFGLAQRHFDTSVMSGRQIFKLRPYWPGFAYWYWAERSYRIQTFDYGVTATGSPSTDPVDTVNAISPILSPLPPAKDTPWVIAEPFGVNSYRDGLVHAAWRPWLGHEFAARDQARSSEKHGIGAVKAKFPRGMGEEHKAAIERYVNGIRTLGSEGVIPCEQRDDGTPSFDAEPFEFSGAGFQSINDTLGANAVALAILFLGHNLTTEIKGGGSYAAAGVADYIRDDKKHEDSETEWSYMAPQLIAPWAEANYGDPGLAPVARYVTDSPAVNKARAEMINYLGMASAQLRANVPKVDLEALVEEFRLPLLPDGAKVQVPAPIEPAGAPKSTESQPSETP